MLTLSVAWSCCWSAKHTSSINIRANLSTLAEIALRSTVIVRIKANMSIILRHLFKPRPCLIEWLCCPLNQLRWIALWLSLVVLQATVSTKMWLIGWWVESHTWNDSSLTFYLAIALYVWYPFMYLAVAYIWFSLVYLAVAYVSNTGNKQ